MTFLTGCLEAGRDGVGDYTRLLAQECSRQGASCEVVALADRHVIEPIHTTAEGDVRTLRLPAGMSWRARLEAFRRRPRPFDPEWVSVQFVPFSYDRRGIATAFVRALPRLRGDARLHVMCHEIWIGPAGSWRRRLASATQRWCVRRLCTYPGAVVHTSNAAYQQLLRREGIASRRLPLFGSIPIMGGDAWPWLGPRLQAVGCDAAVNRGDWWIVVLFGVMPPYWPPEPLFERLREAANAARKRVAIVSAGRLSGGEALWTSLESRYGGRVPMLRLGELSDIRVSELLNTADFGVATSPYSLLGKSAAATAMFEHGLPVIVNREDGFPVDEASGDVDPRQVIRVDARFPERLIDASRAEARSRRRDVAAQFLGDLAAAAVSRNSGQCPGSHVGQARDPCGTTR